MATSRKTYHKLIDELTQNSFDPGTQMGSPFVAFRGSGKIFGNLKTGLQRLQDVNQQLPDWDLLSRERRLIDNFRMYAAAYYTLGTSDWDVLLVAQHYRLPTRLLDWTSNPFVALFFATENRADLNSDGEVWCVHRQKTNELLPPRLKHLLEGQSGYQLFYSNTLSREFPCLSEFDKEAPALLWFEPPSVDQRIINQYAFFSVMPGVGSSTSGWLEQHGDTYWRAQIPAGLKQEIRARLGQMNITYRTIYPGLEGITKWLSDFYGSPIARRLPDH